VDPEDERLFTNARALEFGDWNVRDFTRLSSPKCLLTFEQYPVITAHEASRERWLYQESTLITTATNRRILQPTKADEALRKTNIRKTADKGKHRCSSSSEERKTHRAPIFRGMLRSNSSSSAKSDRSQLVDLVVEDTEAEEIARVKARKEGSPGWNEAEQKKFV
jgi:hypothetical protein